MQVKLTRRINYFNEALLLASYICNFGNEEDSCLPIDHNKIYISKDQLEAENDDIVSFLKLTRTEARAILKKYENTGVRIFFENSLKSDIPELLYFLIYTKLQESIRDITIDEFTKILREEFIDNINSLGYSISYSFSFEEVDNLKIFNEQQRYMLYKLLNNIGLTVNDLYNFILDLENVIRNFEYIINDKLDFYYKILEENAIDEYFDDSLETMIKDNHIKYIEYSILIQLPIAHSFSAQYYKEKLVGYLFLGLTSLILEQNPISIKYSKDDMYNKFNLLSDYTRFNIIILLAKNTMYGKEIADKLKISTGTISHHLSTLIKEGIVVSKIEGKKIYYSINKKEINKMSIFLDQIGENAYEK